MKNEDRNAKILALRGKKSFGLIAKELGLTRNTVAGVCFRHDYPRVVRASSPLGRQNKIGVGHHGGWKNARQTLKVGRPEGSA